MNKIAFGKELILDVHDCDITYFSKKNLEKYFGSLCDVIKMEKEIAHFWIYPGKETECKEGCLAHLAGISAIQFIKTSSITLHTVDKLKRIYVNIFSCKDFDENVARIFTCDYFKGRAENETVLVRK